MMTQMTRFQTLLLLIALLASTMLACNLPLSQSEALPAPTLVPLSIENDDYEYDSSSDSSSNEGDTPQDSQEQVDSAEGEDDAEAVDTDETVSETPTRTRRPTRTPVPTADPADDITKAPLPTFTPIALPPTATLRGESGSNDENNQAEPESDTEDQEEEDIVDGDATPTLQPEFEPLELTFEQTWIFDPDDPDLALATVILTATGGDGDYTYFRDDQQQPAAEFQYKWGKCKKNVGTFRVDSGDEQSISLDFEDESPC